MNKEVKALLTDLAVFDFEASSNDELYDAAIDWASEAQGLLRKALKEDSAKTLTVEVEYGLVKSIHAEEPVAVVVDFDVEGNVPDDPDEAADEGYLEIDGAFAHIYTLETTGHMTPSLRRAVQKVSNPGR